MKQRLIDRSDCWKQNGVKEKYGSKFIANISNKPNAMHILFSFAKPNKLGFFQFDECFNFLPVIFTRSNEDQTRIYTCKVVHGVCYICCHK